MLINICVTLQFVDGEIRIDKLHNEYTGTWHASGDEMPDSGYRVFCKLRDKTFEQML